MRPFSTLLLIAGLLFTNIPGTSAQTFQWARQTGSASFNDEIYPVAHTTDPNDAVIACGVFSGTIDFDPGPGTQNLSSAFMAYDAYIQKLDANGQFVWARALQGNGTTIIQDIRSDQSGNLFICGSFDAPTDFDPGIGVNTVSPTGNEDAFILKLNAAGSFQWVKTFGSTASSSTVASAMAIDFNNGSDLLLTGYFSDSVDFDPGPGVNMVYASGFSDGYVLRLSSAGNFIWIKTLQTVDYMDPSQIILDGGSSIAVGGTFQGQVDMDPGPAVNNLNSGNAENVFLLKLNSGGTYQWAVQVGNDQFEKLGGLGTDNTGNFLLHMSFSDSLDADPGAGQHMVYPQGYDDNMILKINSAGSFVWAAAMGGAGFEQVGGLAVGGDNSVWVCGTFEQSGDFDAGTSVHTLSSNGDYDVYVARYDAFGNFLMAKSLGGTGTDEARQLCLDNQSNLVVSGNFFSTVDFDPGPNAANLTAQSPVHDAFLTKWGTCPPAITSLSAYDCNSYTLNGQTYTASGFYTQILQGASCDSIVQLTLTIGNTNTYLNPVVCGGGSYTLNGQTYTTAGNYVQNYLNAAGCDSNFYINLSFGTPNSSTQNQTACDFYFFGNQMLFTSGVYTQIFTNASGCDSTVTLNLTINNSTYTYSQISNCGPYTLNGQTYTQTGFYSQFYVSAAGCDSVLDLDLIINDTSSSTLTINACKEYLFNGQTLTTSGNYTAVYPNAMGCDSTVHLTLTVIAPNTNVNQSGAVLTSAASAPATYQWIDCGTNLPLLGATGQSYTATANGSYAVIVTLNGCSDTSNCRPVTGIGLDELSTEGLSLYPNPVRDVLYLDLPEGAGRGLIIRNLQGQTVYEGLHKGKTMIPVAAWATGWYTIEAIADGKTMRGRFVVER